MFGIGMPELIIILAVALIVLGPKRLPEIARSLGRAMREFKSATDELKSAVNMDDDIKDIKHTINGVKDDVWNMTELQMDKAPEPQQTEDAREEEPKTTQQADGVIPPVDEKTEDGKTKDE